MSTNRYIVLKNKITACDYKYLVKLAKKVVENNKVLLISPIASQTLVAAFFNSKLKKMLDKFDHLVPDSQWIRHSLRFLYSINLNDRVYGPNLMLKICEYAEKSKAKIFLYGTTTKTLKKLEKELIIKYPKLKIAGLIPSNFGPLDNSEISRLTKNVKNSYATILFIGIGSPKQEELALKIANRYQPYKKPLIIIPVGAAFDFISKVKPQAPVWMQKAGLEWFFRLSSEPKRLWKRYIFLGPLYIFLVIKQKITMLFYPANNIILKDKSRR